MYLSSAELRMAPKGRPEYPANGRECKGGRRERAWGARGLGSSVQTGRHWRPGGVQVAGWAAPSLPRKPGRKAADTGGSRVTPPPLAHAHRYLRESRWAC